MMSQDELADLEAERSQACNWLLADLIENAFPRIEFSTMGWCSSDEKLDAAMKLFHPHEDYLHLMPKFTLEMLELAKPHGEEVVQRLIHWSGVTFADLVEFTHQQND
jgi:hypothetical protein